MNASFVVFGKLLKGNLKNWPVRVKNIEDFTNGNRTKRNQSVLCTIQQSP